MAGGFRGVVPQTRLNTHYKPLSDASASVSMTYFNLATSLRITAFQKNTRRAQISRSAGKAFKLLDYCIKLIKLI